MSDHIIPKNSELLIDVSEQEQKAVSGVGSFSAFGGYDLFLQKTNIMTFANLVEMLLIASLPTIVEDNSLLLEKFGLFSWCEIV